MVVYFRQVPIGSRVTQPNFQALPNISRFFEPHAFFLVNPRKCDNTELSCTQCETFARFPVDK